jgi:hypothetical protein
VRVLISDSQLTVRLAPAEKVLGLMGDITVERSDIYDVRLLEDPLSEVMRAGLKVGLRLPWLYYVCRSIRLDRAWAVRRGTPAITFTVRNHGALEQVTASAPQARELVGRLGG